MTNRPTTRVPRTAPAAAWISTPARHACLGFGLVPEARGQGKSGSTKEYLREG